MPTIGPPGGRLRWLMAVAMVIPFPPGAPAGRLCVDMSTIDPGTSQRVAQKLGATPVVPVR